MASFKENLMRYCGVEDTSQSQFVKESKMTQGKYKQEDDVLIKVRIKAFEKGLIFVGFGINSGFISEDEIYSLAPEFSPGEEIEVSQYDVPNYPWTKAFFIGVYPPSLNKYVAMQDGRIGLWKYARKIQPEVKPLEDLTIDYKGKKYRLTEVV